MKKDKWNLSDNQFDREMFRRLNRCPKCGSQVMLIQILLGCSAPSSWLIQCGRCGYKTEDFQIVEAIGSENRLATIVTMESLLKSLKRALKKFKKGERR